MRTILVTGANRGIGLEFVRQYAEAGDRVIAGCRSPERADALQKIADAAAEKVSVRRLDVGSDASVEALQMEVGEQPLDILISNAGVAGPDKDGQVGSLDLKGWSETMNINALGAARIANAFVGNLRAGAGKKLIAITSGLGSTGKPPAAGWPTARPRPRSITSGRTSRSP